MLNNFEFEYINSDVIFDGKYEKILYDKFTEAYSVNEYEVLTPDGYIPIEGIGKTIEFDEWMILTSGGKSIICADNHLLYRCDKMDFIDKKCELTEIFCKDLSIGDFIMTQDGPEMLMEFGLTGNKSVMYDLQLPNTSQKKYYTNGILSHNSLWMQNFATKSANLGYNVLYITLEMSERKVMKRIGSMRLKVPINEYDRVSKDIDAIKSKIDSLKKSGSKMDNDIFTEKKNGKIFTKFWAAGTATVNDFDNFITKLWEKKGIKINLIIVDYITLIATIKGSNQDSNLYIKRRLIEYWNALGMVINLLVL